MSRRRPMALAISCLLGLSACASTDAMRLAERTAANAGVISAHLGRLAQESGSLADQRAANVARLHAANTRLRASYSYDVALTKKSGGAANLELIDQLEAWGREVDAIFKAADNAEKERKEAVLATQTSLDTKSESLAQIAAALAALAEVTSPKERLRFLAGYANQLRTEVDTRLDQSDKSSTEAKRLLSEVTDRLTVPGRPKDAPGQ